MSLVGHLRELRRRLLTALVAFAAATVIAYAFYEDLLALLAHPYCVIQPRSCALVVLGPLDAFGIRLDVAAYGGLLLSSPVLLWQFWRFVTPGLKENEKRGAVAFVVSGVLLFLLGAATAWWTFPHALGFLHAVGGTQVAALYTAQRYLSLIVLFMAMFGLTFEFPVALVALELVGVLSPERLARFRRWAIVLIVALAGVVTPSADPFSMLVMAVPMVLFYECAIVVGRIAARRRGAPRREGESVPERRR